MPSASVRPRVRDLPREGIERKAGRGREPLWSEQRLRWGRGWSRAGLRAVSVRCGVASWRLPDPPCRLPPRGPQPPLCFPARVLGPLPSAVGQPRAASWGRVSRAVEVEGGCPEGEVVSGAPRAGRAGWGGGSSARAVRVGPLLLSGAGGPGWALWTLSVGALWVDLPLPSAPRRSLLSSKTSWVLPPLRRLRVPSGRSLGSGRWRALSCRRPVRAFQAEPLPVFQSPTTRAAPTWTPPRCGGTTASSSTRSPSRSCRSRWGSEPRPRAGRPTARRWPVFLLGTLGDSDLCAGTKKGKLAEPQRLVSHPSQPAVLSSACRLQDVTAGRGPAAPARGSQVDPPAVTTTSPGPRASLLQSGGV